MGMASGEGESDMYFGTDVEKWGAEGAGFFPFFLPKGGGDFFQSHVCVLEILGFLGRNQIWVKNTEKNFDPLTRPPSRLLAAWLLTRPSVTCHPSLEGAGRAVGGRGRGPLWYTLIVAMRT